MNRREKTVGRALDVAQTLRRDPKIRKAVAAVALLGLAAYAVAGWIGLVVLGVALAIGAWFRPLRQRAVRWYLLG